MEGVCLFVICLYVRDLSVIWSQIHYRILKKRLLTLGDKGVWENTVTLAEAPTVCMYCDSTYRHIDICLLKHLCCRFVCSVINVLIYSSNV